LAMFSCFKPEEIENCYRLTGSILHVLGLVYREIGAVAHGAVHQGGNTVVVGAGGWEVAQREECDREADISESPYRVKYFLAMYEKAAL